MAHKEQQDFLISVKEKFPEKFKNCRVLDIGSLDINGNNRYLFENYSYVGVDIGPGKNVDVVCRGHQYDSDRQFDIVVSTECFEHDEFWVLTIENAIRLTKSNGMFLFTCATTGRKEHGTRRTSSAHESPFTSQLENDYYKNLTANVVMDNIEVQKYFSDFGFSNTEGSKHPDLYFWGIKR
jgi:SAM-dependent methyltransferase